MCQACLMYCAVRCEFTRYVRQSEVYLCLSTPLHSLLFQSLALHPVILPFLCIRSQQHTGNSLEPKNRKMEKSEDRVSFSICYALSRSAPVEKDLAISIYSPCLPKESNKVKATLQPVVHLKKRKFSTFIWFLLTQNSKTTIKHKKSYKK